MQILIYTRSFPPMVGGIETITMQLASRLASRPRASTGTVKVTVVTPTPTGTNDENALPFTLIRKPGFWALVKLISRADVFHLAGTDLLPLLLGWLLQKCMVVEHHGFQTACPNGQLIYQPTQSPCPGHYMAGEHFQCLRCNFTTGPLYSVRQWFLSFPRRWLCLRASTNVIPTAALGRNLQLPRMVTIHHGLPAGSTAVQRSEGPPTIVFLGRLVSTKGVHTLLHAAQRLMDCEFQLTIIGDGPERKRLEAEARSLKLDRRVAFLGYLPSNEAEEHLSAARVVVMPSLGCEVFGLVALENMLRQKALIVSEIGPLTEVVGDAGLTFPAGDDEALAACLRQVLSSEEFAEKMGARAGRRATSFFTPERMVDDHLALYRRLLKSIPLIN